MTFNSSVSRNMVLDNLNRFVVAPYLMSDVVPPVTPASRWVATSGERSTTARDEARP